MAIGDMTESTASVKSWPRSWRQEMFTDGGTDFTFRAHMEIVTSIDGIGVVSKQDGVVERRMSQVKDDKRVQQLAALLQELVAEWRDEDRKKLQIENISCP
jgi:hypothetical protein